MSTQVNFSQPSEHREVLPGDPCSQAMTATSLSLVEKSPSVVRKGFLLGYFVLSYVAFGLWGMNMSITGPSRNRLVLVNQAQLQAPVCYFIYCVYPMRGEAE